MRLIKVRAWDGERMIYKLENLCCDENGLRQRVVDTADFGGETLEQFNGLEFMLSTGRKVAGKEIWVGDIVSLNSARYNINTKEWGEIYAEVVFKSPAFILSNSSIADYLSPENVKDVVGNIYENGDLLDELQ